MERRSKHILLIRLSAMGDVVMITHVVRALRASYPDLRISILTRERFQSIFNGLDVEFVNLDLESRHHGIQGMRRLAKDVANLDVDYVVDLHDTIRTKMFRAFMKMRGIKVAHLLKGRFYKWMRMDGGCNNAIPLRHTVLRYCDVVRSLGFKFDDPTPAVKEPRPNPMSFEKGAEKWIGIAPFAAHEGKIYPLKYMTKVVEELSKGYDRIFLHSGPGKELEYAEQMEKSYPNVTAVFGRLILEEEIDLISNEDCLVTMDSFAMHVGSMVNTPSVSVWGATHPSLGFSGYGAGDEGFVQLTNLTCRPCSTYGKKECRFGDYHCLNEIDPLEIVEKVDQVMKKI